MLPQKENYPIPETYVDIPRKREGLAPYEEGVARRDVDIAFKEITSTIVAETINSVEAAKWASQYTNASVDLRENYQQSNWTLIA